VESGAIERIAQNVNRGGLWLSPDGNLVAYTSWAGVIKNSQQEVYDLLVFSLADRRTRTLVKEIPQTDFGVAVSWSPNSRFLAYTTFGQKATGDCYLVSIKGGEPVDLTPGAHPPFDDRFRPRYGMATEHPSI